MVVKAGLTIPVKFFWRSNLFLGFFRHFKSWNYKHVLFKFEMNPQQNKTFEINEWGKYLIIYTLTTNHQNTKIEVAKLEYVFQYK